jgi:hypothetical protein
VFSLKQKIKIGESHTGVAAVLELTPGSRVRTGMCVLYFSSFFISAHLSSFSLSPPALHPFILQDCHRSP